MNYDDAIKVLTPQQYNQLVEILEHQSHLSVSTNCDQTITLVMRDGKLAYLKASNDRRAHRDTQHQWSET